MAAKSDPAPAEAAAAAPPAPEKSGKLASLLPVVLVLVLSPVIMWTVVQFVLFPQLDKRLAALPAVSTAPAGEHLGSADAVAEAAAPAAAAEHGGKGGEKEGGEKKGGVPNNYEFSNVVVNLAGTMGTRYLKTTFLVTGKSTELKGLFEANKPRLIDVTLNVLSSLTLADLEEAGAKNLIRERLVASYNQALGRKVAEQVYFSDFVVQ
ncbi:MAG: flagellar basal body-associated FliL family protein [Opitutae bacterium]|nr:flagellar basal body-associated FliL family protein [Opitutae bacterium]